MIDILLKNLKGTDWEMLTDFVSPVFFDVVPTFGMASAFASIAKDYADKTKFERVREQVAKSLEDPLKIAIAKTRGEDLLASLSHDKKIERGEKVLEVYFRQLLTCETGILDLRSSSFSGTATWHPNSIYYRWKPDFRSAIAGMYRGFYLGDDAAFNQGLRELNLLHAADKFRAHFGSGSQEAVTFKLSEFKKSFHAIFVSCKENRAKLHPDFFALGVYLVCLYEHLEALGVPLNVRASFIKAQG